MLEQKITKWFFQFASKISFLSLIDFFSRSKNIVEPMLKPQWWVNCTEMSAEALKVVQSGQLKIVPQA